MSPSALTPQPGPRNGRTGFATIDEVLEQLDSIIGIARRRGSADGYFAALYRRVTAEVKARIEGGFFEDGPRMARFDILFAARYIDAWLQYESGGPTTACWRVALGCGTSYWPVVMQHLLLGMNAHINFDLGIVAAEVAPGPAILALQCDFDRINRILTSQVDDVQIRMGRVWPGVRILDRAGGGFDERLVNFSIVRARAASWAMATRLAAETDPRRREHYIQYVDTSTALLGRGILNPGLKLSTLLAMVRLRERGSVADKLDVLLR